MPYDIDDKKRILSTVYDKTIEQLEEEGLSGDEIQTYVSEADAKRRNEGDWKQEIQNYDAVDWEKVEKTMNKDKGDSLRVFTVHGQAERFYEEHPYFYDKSGMFFLWDKENFKYELCDKTDLLNGISDKGVDTISSKTRTEIINALEQYGRKKIPKPEPKTWIQFKNKVFDFKTGEVFNATPEYFITSPIPWEVGETEDTPVMDNLFEQWVGKEYVQTLYEIVAYSCSSHQFMQRMIALVGGGANGKGTFLSLLKKFIGKNNISSSELKELSTNGFETSAIYKKLLCIMGEISHDDLKNTNQIKKLAGEDEIRYCFKGKTPFSEESITTLISATNSLPNTPDKTIGFYRRWLIVDFPNQFKIKEGVLETIPEQEDRNLAKKVIRILNEIYKTHKFTNEGDFEERAARYEERSNPLMRFIDKYCEEEPEVNTELRSLSIKFNEYAKIRHLRTLSVIQIGKILREEGFEIGTRNVWSEGNRKISKKVVLNLRIKLLELPELPKIQRDITCKSIQNSGSFSSSSNQLDVINENKEFLENCADGIPAELLAEINRLTE